MFVVFGVGDRVTEAVVRQLRAAWLDVRVVVPPSADAGRWEAAGCEVVAPDGPIGAPDADGAPVEGLWLAPDDGAPPDAATVAAWGAAVVATGAERVVLRSWLGAHDPAGSEALARAAAAEAALRGACAEEQLTVLRAPLLLDDAVAGAAPAGARWAAVHAADVGRAAAEALLDADVGELVELVGQEEVDAVAWGASPGAPTGLWAALQEGRMAPERPEDVRRADSALHEALDEIAGDAGGAPDSVG